MCNRLCVEFVLSLELFSTKNWLYHQNRIESIVFVDLLGGCVFKPNQHIALVSSCEETPFRLYYLERNAYLSQFFWISIALAKIYFSTWSYSRAKTLVFRSHRPLKTIFFSYFREEAGDTTVKEEITEVRKYLACSSIYCVTRIWRKIISRGSRPSFGYCPSCSKAG